MASLTFDALAFIYFLDMLTPSPSSSNHVEWLSSTGQFGAILPGQAADPIWMPLHHSAPECLLDC